MTDLARAVKNKSEILNQRNMKLYFDMRSFYDRKRVKRYVKSKMFSHYVDTRLVSYKGNIRLASRCNKIDIKEIQETGIGGPLPKNTVCKFVAISPKYIGSVQSKPVKPDFYFNKYMNMLASEGRFTRYVKEWRESLNEYREVWTGGTAGNMANLLQMADDKIGYDGKYSHILNVLNEGALNKIFGRTPVGLPNPDISRIDEIIKIRPDSSPGLYTKSLFGHKRFSSVHNSIVVSRTLLEMLKDQGFANWTLWEMLGREKSIKVSVDQEEGTTRLVLNMEEPLMLLNLLYAQPITMAISSDVHNNIFIGKTFDLQTIQSLCEREKQYDCIVEADWKSFDVHITKDLIKVAIGILSQAYEDNEYNRHMFLYIYLSIVNKYVAVEPGFVYKISKGIPSGHPFTSLIGSYVNLILWCLIGNEIFGPDYYKYMDVIVSGDDCYVLFKFIPNLLKRIEDVSRDVLRMEIKDLKMTPANNEIYIDYRPSLLKRKFLKCGYVEWVSSSIIEKMMYPGKYKQFINDRIDVVSQYIFTAPLDIPMVNLLHGYVRFFIHSTIHPSLYRSYDISLIDARKNGLDKIMGCKPINLEVIDLLLPKASYNDQKYFRFDLTKLDPEALLLSIMFYCPTRAFKDFRSVVKYVLKIFMSFKTAQPPPRDVENKLVNLMKSIRPKSSQT